MNSWILAAVLTVPAAPPEFSVSTQRNDLLTGRLTAISWKAGAELLTADGPKIAQGLIGIQRTRTRLPDFPHGPHLITAAGDRMAGILRGGDTKTLEFQPHHSAERWSVPLDTVAAVWLIAPPADTPLHPTKYSWLTGTPARDAIRYRNGDILRGTISGFSDNRVKFKPDDGPTRDIEFRDLAAIGFNPRFAKARKPQETYAQLVLENGSRLVVTDITLKEGELIVQPLCGSRMAIPLAQLVSLTVLQGPATYLADLKLRKAESRGFLGIAWPWAANQNVRGQPLRLMLGKEIYTFDLGIGTHPLTELTYDLAGQFQRFEAYVGLDPVSGPRGRAKVQILRDGKTVELPELADLTAGPAVFVQLDVRDVKELTLRIDYGPAGDVQADVNWGAARVIAK
ncbi:MAG: NPCBM/NEW2 domain-containing protein [Gemmataceae bacterium]|nr:NPCBM/NEW2 domain-containing protein [Gemmata sp.]MDW8199289.1 NPCBM/NEW2 domain-containing protein [Gemmataceae bacterium]